LLHSFLPLANSKEKPQGYLIANIFFHPKIQLKIGRSVKSWNISYEIYLGIVEIMLIEI